jgi:hypothetical protein
MTGQNFSEFLGALRRGDQRAAAELVRRCLPQLRTVVRLHLAGTPWVRSLYDSLDVCQSVLGDFFARTLGKHYPLQSTEDLCRLLATMARRKVADKRRMLARHPDRLPKGWDAPAADPPPDEAAARQEMVHKILDRFTPRERWLAEQRALGRSWVDLAREAGAEPDLLRIQYARAVTRVRAQFQARA